ncbi:MAG: hypothetical protein IIA62_07360 [Nitrospinae bacterium]|nr:hypothetical protein [Nitrospinota bacterium]
MYYALSFEPSRSGFWTGENTFLNGDRSTEALEDYLLIEIGLNQEEWVDMKKNIPAILEDLIRFIV